MPLIFLISFILGFPEVDLLPLRMVACVFPVDDTCIASAVENVPLPPPQFCVAAVDQTASPITCNQSAPSQHPNRPSILLSKEDISKPDFQNAATTTVNCDGKTFSDSLVFSNDEKNKPAEEVPPLPLESNENAHDDSSDETLSNLSFSSDDSYDTDTEPLNVASIVPVGGGFGKDHEHTLNSATRGHNSDNLTSTCDSAKDLDLPNTTEKDKSGPAPTELYVNKLNTNVASVNNDKSVQHLNKFVDVTLSNQYGETNNETFPTENSICSNTSPFEYNKVNVPRIEEVTSSHSEKSFSEVINCTSVGNGISNNFTESLKINENELPHDSKEMDSESIYICETNYDTANQPLAQVHEDSNEVTENKLLPTLQPSLESEPNRPSLDSPSLPDVELSIKKEVILDSPPHNLLNEASQPTEVTSPLHHEPCVATASAVPKYVPTPVSEKTPLIEEVYVPYASRLDSNVPAYTPTPIHKIAKLKESDDIPCKNKSSDEHICKEEHIYDPLGDINDYSPAIPGKVNEFNKCPSPSSTGEANVTTLGSSVEESSEDINESKQTKDTIGPVGTEEDSKLNERRSKRVSVPKLNCDYWYGDPRISATKYYPLFPSSKKGNFHSNERLLEDLEGTGQPLSNADSLLNLYPENTEGSSALKREETNALKELRPVPMQRTKSFDGLKFISDSKNISSKSIKLKENSVKSPKTLPMKMNKLQVTSLVNVSEAENKSRLSGDKVIYVKKITVTKPLSNSHIITSKKEIGEITNPINSHQGSKKKYIKKKNSKLGKNDLQSSLASEGDSSEDCNVMRPSSKNHSESDQSEPLSTFIDMDELPDIERSDVVSLSSNSSRDASSNSGGNSSDSNTTSNTSQTKSEASSKKKMISPTKRKRTPSKARDKVAKKRKDSTTSDEFLSSLQSDPLKDDSRFEKHLQYNNVRKVILLMREIYTVDWIEEWLPKQCHRLRQILRGEVYNEMHSVRGYLLMLHE